MTDDLTSALSGVRCVMFPGDLPCGTYLDDTEGVHPECITAFLTDPANAPLLLGIPVVAQLWSAVDLMQKVKAMGMPQSEEAAQQCTFDALAPFTKPTTGGGMAHYAWLADKPTTGGEHG